MLNGNRITKSFKSTFMQLRNNSSDLMVAIVNKEFKEFKKLVDKVDLEEEDKFGDTALLVAASNGRLQMIKMLITRGANIYHKNKENKDFYDLADERYKFINLITNYIEKNYPEFISAKKYNI